jgi:hypothetical protein
VNLLVEDILQSIKTIKREDRFDMIGNAPEAWFESAMDLLTASAELRHASKARAQSLGIGIPFTRSFWPRLMVRAFAVECLIKARFLGGGKKLCKGGKYVGMRNDHHDLVKLARQVADLTISDAEANLLDRLSAVAVVCGRYPIGKRPDSPGSRSKWASRNEILFRSLIRRLGEPLDRRSLYSELVKEA